ncbi:MAG: ABC transporter ATP-binding protein [Pygmaiobacter sp.]|nr:ABC transporter ATP-binding protein [Pygmaiobacter sp.]
MKQNTKRKKSADLKTLKRILKLIGPYRRYLAAAVVGALLNVVLALAIPVLVGRAVDHIVGPGEVDFTGMVPILAVLAAAVAGSALFGWLMTLATNTITYRAVRDLRRNLFEKLQQLPLATIDASSHGDFVSRMVNDVDQVSTGLLQGFSQLFTGVITILGTLVFMFSLHFGIALVVVVLTPLSLFVSAFIARHIQAMFVKQAKVQGDLTGYLNEMTASQKIVKAFGYEARAEQEFDEINRDLYHWGVRAQFYSALTNPVTRFINGVVYAAVGLTGALTVIGGGLTVGGLASFLSYANQYTKPFNEISGVVAQFQAALAGAARIFTVLDEAEQTPEPADVQELQQCEGRVQMEQVAFSYTPDRPLIRDLNVEAAPGTHIALVGPTGCGKTTLINLLMRFYDVNEGTIKVDDHPIRSLTRSSLRGSFGMVLQDTWLFSGTVRENITYGRPGASEGELIAAAKAAHAHSFIKRLPQGYDTPVGEGGGNLSQGQRQLLCIARIMLTSPPMLILDEATSSIDTRTESKIQRAFDEMMAGRTSFVVAHRLSTIRNADCILVMDAGRIVERGTHDELLAKGGFYAKLYNSQFAPTH